MALTPSNVNDVKPWLQYYPEWTAHSLEYGCLLYTSDAADE